MGLPLRKSRVEAPPACPLTECMALLRGAWAPNVIWHLSGGARRFGELLAQQPIGADNDRPVSRLAFARGVQWYALAPVPGSSTIVPTGGSARCGPSGAVLVRIFRPAPRCLEQLVQLVGCRPVDDGSSRLWAFLLWVARFLVTVATEERMARFLESVGSEPARGSSGS